MRSASVDNRSRGIWLLAGLGVLIWAALCVFLGGSPAHADEAPVHPPKQVQTSASRHAHPPTPYSARAEVEQKRAQHQSDAARTRAAQKAAPQKAAPQRSAAGHRIVAPATKPSSPRASAALPQAATDRMNAATQRMDAAMQARDEAARSLPQRASRSLALHRQDRDGNPARRDHAGDWDPRPRSQHADMAAWHEAREAARHHAAHAANHSAGITHGAQALRSPRTTLATSVRTVPAPAAVTSGAASEKAPGPSPFDTGGASTQHQPAAPPSASSAGAGPSASAGVLPGALQASDVLGPVLAAAHAGDEVVPTGPAGTTDHSPD